MKRPFDWFLPGLLCAVALAWLFPNPGAAGGWMHPEILTKAGIALIFFLHGVALSFDKLKAGILRWPLHLVVQSCTFGFFPLVGLFLLHFFGGLLLPDLRLGFFYLCALPSTVSSSVAMTAAARGNVPVAVFNATLSSLLGIFLTPLWIGLVMQSGGEALPLGHVILDLVLWLLLPLVIGPIVSPDSGELGERAQNLHQHGRSRYDSAAGLHFVLRFGEARRVDKKRRRSADSNRHRRFGIIFAGIFLHARRVPQTENRA